MTPELDLREWLNDEQVCAALGISQRSLDREVQAGKWQPQRRPREGKKPERVFHPHQVQARMRPAPAVVERSHTPSQDIAPIAPPMSELAEYEPERPISRMEVIGLVNAMLEGMKPPARFIRTEEASEITGLSMSCLRRLRREGKIPYILDQSIKMSREFIQTFDPTAPAPKSKRKKKDPRQ